APFHYMSASLHPGAKCFGLWANGQLAAFAAMLHRPHPTTDNIMGCSRLVTLPDWQGLGLAFVLIEAIGGAYKAIGKRIRTYPAHPALIQAFAKSTKWRLEKKPGHVSLSTKTSGLTGNQKIGTRPCGVFEYAGSSFSREEAECLLG